MKQMLFAAAALSLILSAPAALAQTSGQGIPNSEHGSGDMMQDGPHASAAPESASPSLGGGPDYAYVGKHRLCLHKWHRAVARGTTAGRLKHDFIEACMERA